MAKKLFKITSYHLTEDMPTQYPIPLRIEECEVNSHKKVNDFRNNACATTPASDDGGFFCMRVQEYEKNESDPQKMGDGVSSPIVVAVGVSFAAVVVYDITDVHKNQNSIREAMYCSSSSIFMRTCSMESLSRTVTQPSVSDSKSKVTQKGVPISS